MLKTLPVLRPALVALILLLLLPTCGGSSTPGATPAGPVLIGLQQVATGLPPPVFLTHAGDGSGRLFVVLQTGQIRVIDASGALLPTPFLDVAGLMMTLDGTFDERGLLGLAFHPQYASNGRFFVRYSAARTGVMGDPCFGTSRGCHTSVFSEFVVQGDPTTNNVADAGSERVLFTIDQPQFNHNSGHVEFGPSGFLYFSLGDGGGAHDGLADNPISHGPLGHGQDKTTALGSILRIDVDSVPPMGEEYVIPADNPFVGTVGLDEIWAYGLRNPYRFSFDLGVGGSGLLYCADVGQNLFEEIDIIVKGGNYGWVTREGFACFDPLDPGNPPATCSATGPSGEPLIDPVLVYDHTVGISIIGGCVYRGQAVGALSGMYVFGDYAEDFGGATGKLFAMDTQGPNAFQRRKLQIEPGDLAFGNALFGFGQDEAGEIYALGSTVASPAGTSGSVFRIVNP